MITIITEPPKNVLNQDKLISIFKDIKESNKKLDINLKIAKRTDAMRGYSPKDNEILIIFGNRLYQHVLRDIKEFDKIAGNPQREVHKFSYFVRRDKKHYFIACMPPIDFAMSKPDTFMAFESFMTSLRKSTNDFKLSVRDTYINKSSSRHNWPIDVIENGFSPVSRQYMKYDEVKNYLYSLFDLPDWSIVAIDTETNGLEIWNDKKHDIRIASFATEDNLGHAINISLPGLIGCYKNGQSEEIIQLLEKYIFEKPKVFVAWKCDFDIFAICNFFNRSYRDFLKANRILDGIQLLHILCEDRKVEGYSLKVTARDFLNYAQYSFVQKYLHYLNNWKDYTIEQILEAASASLKYAAEDSAAEYSLTTLLKKEIESDPIVSKHLALVAPKIMAVKLESEWNGLTIDKENMAKAVISCSGWELENIIKPTLKRCEESSDGRLHPELFVFSTKTGRMYYGKPFLNGMTMGSCVSEFFIADPGHTLVYIDLDSADLRSAALVTGDSALIQDLNSFEDYYIRFARTSIYKGMKVTSIEEKERNIIKQFVLSMLNLAGDSTIAKETGVSIGDVKAYKEKFYSRYPNMMKYKINLQTFVKNNSFTFSAGWRKRRFSEDDLDEKNFWRSYLSAHNFAFQATTADLMALNCFEFVSNTRELGVKLCLINVDAAVFNVPDESLDCIRKELNVFETVPQSIKDGAKKIQEMLLLNEENGNLHIQIPRITFKTYKGKNFREMEKW
jgi:DNA polymerase I-like protein with 3'-5' exonuclease and polymerase domains